MRQSLIQILAVILSLQIGGAPAFAGDEITLKGLDKDKKEISLDIPNSSAEELRQQSPAKIRQILLDGIASAKRAGAGLAREGSKIGEVTKAGVVHSTVRLLPESGAFFIALGTVVARQVMTDYAQNPVGLSQFLEHQISPVGAFSFWTFMATQGVTSNLLMMYLKNPKFHSMIPYMGMTVGFAAQSFVAEIISDPDIWTCASSLMGIKKIDQATGDAACTAAHEHFILTKKLAQYSPGFVSMMLSVIGATIIAKE